MKNHRETQNGFLSNLENELWDELDGKRRICQLLGGFLEQFSGSLAMFLGKK